MLQPLDAEHQEAFVSTVRDMARAGSCLALGVVIGLAFAWLQGFGRR